MQVWDYISDGYVHRLIQSSLDGKLVEVPSPQLPGGQQHQQLDTVSNNCRGPGDGPVKATSSSVERSSSEVTRAMNEDYHMLQVCFFFPVLVACCTADPGLIAFMQLSWMRVLHSSGNSRIDAQFLDVLCF
jgi:hypothetical protein